VLQTAIPVTSCAPRSTDLSPIAVAEERVIGTLRRECLDQMIIFGETHLRRILYTYVAYYNQAFYQWPRK
jgi:hypothetical protein